MCDFLHEGRGFSPAVSWLYSLLITNNFFKCKWCWLPAKIGTVLVMAYGDINRVTGHNYVAELLLEEHWIQYQFHSITATCKLLFIPSGLSARLEMRYLSSPLKMQLYHLRTGPTKPTWEWPGTIFVIMAGMQPFQWLGAGYNLLRTVSVELMVAFLNTVNRTDVYPGNPNYPRHGHIVSVQKKKPCLINYKLENNLLLSSKFHAINWSS